MTSIISTITKDLIKTGVALSFSAFAYSNLKKALSTKNFQTQIRRFVSQQSAQYQKQYVMAKNIILVASQESEKDIDMNILNKIPNHEITLTEDGMNQSSIIGQQVQKHLDELTKKSQKSIKISAYSSPYVRAKQTLEQMKMKIKSTNIIAVTDLNLRDQDSGNLPKNISSSEVQQEKELITPFFFRYEDGESEADVFMRVSNFSNTIMRELNNFDRNMNYQKEEKVILIVAHPLIISQLDKNLKNLDSDQLLNIQTFNQ